MKKVVIFSLCFIVLAICSSSWAETKIAGGFSYSNVSFKEQLSMTIVIGEMTNNSNKDYTIANFMVSAYDNNGKLIGTGYINISNFSNGQTKTFEGFVDADYNSISKYKIQFENGF